MLFIFPDPGVRMKGTVNVVITLDLFKAISSLLEKEKTHIFFK